MSAVTSFNNLPNHLDGFSVDALAKLAVMPLHKWPKDEFEALLLKLATEFALPHPLTFFLLNRFADAARRLRMFDLLESKGEMLEPREQRDQRDAERAFWRSINGLYRIQRDLRREARELEDARPETPAPAKEQPPAQPAQPTTPAPAAKIPPLPPLPMELLPSIVPPTGLADYSFEELLTETRKTSELLSLAADYLPKPSRKP